MSLKGVRLFILSLIKIVDKVHIIIYNEDRVN